MVSSIPAGEEDHSRWSFADWRSELRSGPATSGVFTSAEIEGLEDPVRRYLSHAIAPGTPLAQCAEITMRGHIKIGRWLPFRARQILRPRAGFIWAARVGGIITGSDRYLAGVGAMDWKVAGLLSVASAAGPDVSRSAAGRGGAEAVWLPTAMLPRFGVGWSAQSPHHVTAHHCVGTTPIDAHLHLNPDGSPASVVFDRWGDPDQTGRWDWYRFGGNFTEHRTFAGLTIPCAGRLGWHYGTDGWDSGEFFRYRISGLRLLEPTADGADERRPNSRPKL